MYRLWALPCCAAVGMVVGCNALLDIDGVTFDDTVAGGGAPTGVGGDGGNGGSTTTTGTDGGASAGGAGGMGGVGGTGGVAGAGGAGGAGGGPVLGFFDDFNRPDGPDLGNGWIEKLPSVYSLVGGRVVTSNPITDYRDNMVYRASSEDVRDLEISLEFSLNAIPPNFPQIFVRGQSSTIATPDTYDGYLLYIAGSNSQAILGRQLGNVFVVALISIPLSPTLNTTDTYRMRLSAQGGSPVQLDAAVERFDGNTWQVIGSATHNDSGSDRISFEGTWGLAGDDADTFSYDNFVMTPL